MLVLEIPGRELYDEESNLFSQTKPFTLRLEHSLVSVSKWEAKWKKPFLSRTEKKTNEESIDYIRCMTLTQNVPDDVYANISPIEMGIVNKYIETDLTATTFSYESKKVGSQVITSELIYSWMISYGIPFECQKWHLSRLLTLLRICEINSNPGKKMSRREVMSRNQALNAARRKKLNTKG